MLKRICIFVIDLMIICILAPAASPPHGRHRRRVLSSDLDHEAAPEFDTFSVPNPMHSTTSYGKRFAIVTVNKALIKMDSECCIYYLNMNLLKLFWLYIFIYIRNNYFFYIRNPVIEYLN